MKNKTSVAIILILVGIFLFIKNLGFLSGNYTLFIISSAFFVAYIFSHNKRGRIGLLIPACILLSLGAYTQLEPWANTKDIQGTLFFIFIGTSFMLVYFIHNVWESDIKFGEKNWPLITGLSIYTFSFVLFMIEKHDSIVAKQILSNIWPILLILFGLYILISTLIRKE